MSTDSPLPKSAGSDRLTNLPRVMVGSLFDRAGRPIGGGLVPGPCLRTLSFSLVARAGCGPGQPSGSDVQTSCRRIPMWTANRVAGVLQGMGLLPYFCGPLLPRSSSLDSRLKDRNANYREHNRLSASVGRRSLVALGHPFCFFRGRHTS